MTGKRLLVVDDEPDFGAFVRTVAEEMGYTVEAISAPREFRHTFAAFEPNLIILDIVMPEIDGIELTQWLAEQQFGGRVLLVSGYNPQYANTAQIIGDAKGLAIEAFVKPIPLAHLREALA